MLNPNASVMVFGGEDFGRWFGHDGGNVMDEISAFIKEISERYLAFSTMWEHSKRTKKQALYRHWIC